MNDTNTVAVVTGGGTGIGRAVATRLAKEGVSVVICGRRVDVIRDAANFIRESTGTDVLGIPCNIRDPEAVASLFTEAESHYGGPVTVLVNNAGGQFPCDALKLSPGGWRAVVDTNLNGTFWCSQEFAKRLVAIQREGVILNMTIPWQSRGSAGLSHSVAARSGVVGLTRSLALEWARFGIRVNCISPGMVVTDGFIDEELGGNPEVVEKMLSTVPLGRATTPEEVAEVMVHMVSPAYRYMTGHTLNLDGGAVLGVGINWLEAEAS
jgi:citronellol/citronellal dehydrogenase